MSNAETLQTKWTELIKTKEELHPDLVPYLEEVEMLGTCIRHPLVFSVPHAPQLNAIVNHSYRQKKEIIEQAMKNGNFSEVIMMYEKPYRMDTLIRIASKIPRNKFWKLMASTWIEIENTHSYSSLYKAIFRTDDCRAMMNKEEMKLFNSLPEKIAIYRGHQKKNANGWSWTLDYHRAKWFETRLGQKGGVARRIVDKSEIVAVLLGRSELEVIARPLCGKPEFHNYIPGADVDKKLRELVSGVSMRGGSHGLAHWLRVHDIGMALADATPWCDRRVVSVFAMVHDSQRLNEMTDPDHGRRASQFVIEHKEYLELSDSQVGVLVSALDLHDEGHTSNDPTIGVCWDADRLDLPRVGILPDKKYLSTKAAVNLMWTI